MRRYLFPLCTSLLLAGCFPRIHTVKTAIPTVVDGKIWSSLFQQRAAEYRALCIQAYNIARLRIDQWHPVNGSRPPAIITDIDETFLDNSPYAVHQALAGKDYEQASWYEWTAKGMADTLSGAVSFFNYAAVKNMTIFYITNRDEQEREGTLQNLKKFNLPFADNEHLIMRQGTSSKEARRQALTGRYDIILLLGDNLADFSALFDKRSEAERSAAVQGLSHEFGNRFILLPNFNYGGWEEALYHNSFNWTANQKDSIIRSAIKGY